MSYVLNHKLLTHYTDGVRVIVQKQIPSVLMLMFFVNIHHGTLPLNNMFGHPGDPCLRIGQDPLFSYDQPPRLYKRTVQKIFGEGCKGFMLILTRKQSNWWWMMGETTADWVDIPPNSTILETKEGIPFPDEHCRLVYFDAIGQQQTEIDMDEERGEEEDPYGELSHEVDPYPTNPWGYPDQDFVGREHRD